jgi:hypothetical protein
MTWAIGIAAAFAAVYGLHWLALRLEKSGWLRYRGGGAGAGAGALFAELQKVYEPPMRHVYELKEEVRPRREAESGNPPPAQQPPVPPGSPL